MINHEEYVFYYEEYINKTFVILSGPSAGGKTTLSKIMGLRKGFTLLIKHTDRSVRSNEENKVDYFFVSSNVFNRNSIKHNWVVWVKRYGHHYALSASEVERALIENTIPLFILDPNAAIKFRSVYKNSILVFVGPDDIAEVHDRIMKRSDSDLEKLLRTVLLEEEYNLRNQFDITYNNKDEDEFFCKLAKMVEERRDFCDSK